MREHSLNAWFGNSSPLCGHWVVWSLFEETKRGMTKTTRFARLSKQRLWWKRVKKRGIEVKPFFVKWNEGNFLCPLITLCCSASENCVILVFHEEAYGRLTKRTKTELLHKRSRLFNFCFNNLVVGHHADLLSSIGHRSRVSFIASWIFFSWERQK